MAADHLKQQARNSFAHTVLTIWQAQQDATVCWVLLMLHPYAVQVTERTVFENVHEYQVNSMRFLPGRDGMSLLTASCDGLICVLDIETGCHHALCNLNPGGWISGVSNERNWNMMQSLAVHPSQPDGGWAGDNQGRVRLVLIDHSLQCTRTHCHTSAHDCTE